MDAWLQSGRRGVAPPAQFGARLLEATTRLRPRRSAAREEMARKIQRRRAPHLGWAGLRQGTDADSWVPAGPRVPRYLGQRAVPVALPARDRPARVAPG